MMVTCINLTWWKPFFLLYFPKGAMKVPGNTFSCGQKLKCFFLLSKNKAARQIQHQISKIFPV